MLQPIDRKMSYTLYFELSFPAPCDFTFKNGIIILSPRIINILWIFFTAQRTQSFFDYLFLPLTRHFAKAPCLSTLLLQLDFPT